MGINVYYLIFFVAAIVILLWAVIYGGSFSANQILLIMSVVVGNGGYFALSLAEGLDEAILATKIVYVGIFTPLLLFVTVCEIFRINIPRIMMLVMYGIQTLLYFSVLFIGRSDLFYRSVEYNRAGDIVYLVKEYGPLHTVHIIMMFFYFIALIVVSTGLVKKKRKVSTKDMTFIFMLEFFTMAFYIAERMVKLRVELLPLIYALALLFVMIPVHRLNTFSLSGSNEAIRRRLDLEGYIFFDRRLHYMGCNDKAMELFPELDAWELEKKIPGSGGRFNTYLRQSLYACTSSKDAEMLKGGSFTMHDEDFIYRIGTFKNNFGAIQGYIIELDRAVSDTKEETNEKVFKTN